MKGTYSPFSPNSFCPLRPAAAGLTASAVTFTNDTIITFNNTNYDGLDIVVTNCTVTVDGPHSFASLQVLNGGNLTHTLRSERLLENCRPSPTSRRC